jgi:hypothetical protein
MINQTMNTRRRQAELVMPACDTTVAAATRALPLAGGVSVPAAAVASFDGTAVSGYGHTTDDTVIKGAFPGASAWSPPI